jgi:hypothetical protein
MAIVIWERHVKSREAALKIYQTKKQELFNLNAHNVYNHLTHKDDHNYEQDFISGKQNWVSAMIFCKDIQGHSRIDLEIMPNKGGYDIYLRVPAVELTCKHGED